ncbi:MAG: CDP-alcohol phosphatidyltransferase family protein [bacterium]|nr:CDP-alcohol phosphatidyltransferase family protein [bacterium]
MLTKIKPRISPVIDWIARPFTFIHPNVLSLIGTIPYFLFFIFLKENLFLALIISIGFSFDFIDGAVARLTNKQSAFGGVIDSTIDRFTDALLILSFAYANLVSWELASSVLVASFLISYLRSRGELASNGNLNLAVGIVERTERIGIILLSIILYILFPAFIFLSFNIVGIAFVFVLILSSFTIYQRLHTTYHFLKNSSK